MSAETGSAAADLFAVCVCSGRLVDIHGFVAERHTLTCSLFTRLACGGHQAIELPLVTRRLRLPGCAYMDQAVAVHMEGA